MRNGGPCVGCEVTGMNLVGYYGCGSRCGEIVEEGAWSGGVGVTHRGGVSKPYGADHSVVEVYF